MKSKGKILLISALLTGLLFSCGGNPYKVHRKPEKHRAGAMSKTLKKKGENCGCHE